MKLRLPKRTLVPSIQQEPQPHGHTVPKQYRANIHTARAKEKEKSRKDVLCIIWGESFISVGSVPSRILAAAQYHTI